VDSVGGLLVFFLVWGGVCVWIGGTDKEMLRLTICKFKYIQCMYI